MAKRTGRPKNQLSTCYYEGYLEKRSFKDKTSRKLWTCLCGNALFFFNEKRDAEYIEKLDLSGLISVTDDFSPDRNLDAARLNVQMKNGIIKFTAPNAESRELWKGFILSVVELYVPPCLNLLPGQIHMLNEAVEKEKERLKNIPPSIPVNNSSSYVSVQPDMPVSDRSQPKHLDRIFPGSCYHSVTRLEAELLLDKEAKKGNLLLRPGRDGNSFAVTTRQDLNGPIFRHYRVARNPEGGFTIAVDNPVPCATLHDVISYLIDKTDGVLIPLVFEEQYEKNISFIWSDNENGERSVQQALPNVVPPSLPPKPVSLRTPTPEPELVPVAGDNVYLNDMLKETENSSAVPLPQPEKKPTKKAMIPPTPAPRKLSTTASPPSSSSSTNKDIRMRANTDPQGQIPLAAITELKLKLEQKAMLQE